MNVLFSDALARALILDKSGKVIERFQGRIPAGTWDRMAELL